MKNSKNKNVPQQKIKRRSFLKGTAVAGTAVGAGVLTTQTLAESVVEQPAPAENKGYRETEHIRKYYRLARF